MEARSRWEGLDKKTSANTIKQIPSTNNFNLMRIELIFF